LLLLLLVSLLLTVLPSVSTASSSSLVVTGAAGRVFDEEVCAAFVVSDVEVAFCEALVGVDDGGGLDVTSVGFWSVTSALGVSLGVAVVELAVVIVLEGLSSAEDSWRIQNWPV
jgi:hypothetical protein